MQFIGEHLTNRVVTVYRLIAKDTIEEGVFQCAQNKLRLERDMAASDEGELQRSNFEDLITCR